MAAGKTTTPTTGDGGGRHQDSPAADEAARSISRWSRQCVTAGLSFVLWVMPAAHASREHSKKSTLSRRIRLREKCLQAKFSGRRPTSACACSGSPTPTPTNKCGNAAARYSFAMNSSMPKPVAICTGCGAFTTARANIGRPCGRRLAHGRCKGVYLVASHPEYWVTCRRCKGKGKGTAGHCAVCQGTGWQYVKPRG